MLRVLLSDTTLEIKVKDATSSLFTSNIGSPQGDCIIGPMFTLVLNEAIEEIKEEINKVPIDVRDINAKYVEMNKSNLPGEVEYADDCDFLTEIEKKKQNLKKPKEFLARYHLLANESKTEQTIIERKRKQTDEKWRDVIKLGSKIGDKEGIKRRKELATTAMKNNDNIWKKNWTASLKKRLQLCNALVKSFCYTTAEHGVSTKQMKEI